MDLIHFYIVCYCTDLSWTGQFAATNHTVLAKILRKRGVKEAYDITTEDVSRIL